MSVTLSKKSVGTHCMVLSTGTTPLHLLHTGLAVGAGLRMRCSVAVIRGGGGGNGHHGQEKCGDLRGTAVSVQCEGDSTG